jgi:uroporphyrinogen-III synthase
VATRSALVVYSGGKPPDIEELFASKGFSVRSVASHRIEVTSQTFPLAGKVDRILFTSRNAVEAFPRAELGMHEKAILHAVGDATGEALRRIGRRADVPAIGSAEGLLRSLPAHLDGEFIFWPRGDDADLALVDELRKRGAEVYAPSIYRKVALPFPIDVLAEIQDRRYAAYSCTSGAAARWLFGHLEAKQAEVLRSLPAAVLGEKTAGALRELGAARIVPAAGASFEKLAEGLLALLEESVQRSKT